MTCPHCAAPTNPAQKFCARCGSPLLSPPPTPTALVEQEAQHPTSTPTPTFDQFAPSYPSPNAQYPAPEPSITRRRSRTPYGVAGTALLVIAIPAIALALLLAGRADTSRPPDPEATLKQAADAMSQVKTFSYRSEAGFFGIDAERPGVSITDTRPLTITLQGDVSLPRDYTLDANISQIGQNITIGDATWKRDGPGDPWVRQNTADSSLGLVNPLTFPSYLAYAQPGTAQLINTDRQGGKTLHRIRFKVDTARMAAATTDPSTRLTLSNSSINVDAWVDAANGNRLDRMTLSVEAQNGAGVILRTSFSGYNKPVNIAPPQ